MNALDTKFREDSKLLRERLSTLLASSGPDRPRRLLVLAGSREWTHALAAAVVGEQAPLWIGRPREEADLTMLPAAKAGKLLGREFQHVVFDAREGFDVDALGIVAGVVRGGGLLLLLTPPLREWPLFPDPERQRITVAPFGPEAVGGRFLARLARIVAEDPLAIVVEEGRPIPEVVPFQPVTPAATRTNQADAVAAIVRVVRGHRRRPLVLCADRGRGKSAALGIAAAQLMRDGLRRLLVTGPRRDATEAVFRHAAELLPEAEQRRGELLLGEASLRYLPPDELASQTPPADLLLVDEAAAIPTPLLTRLLKHYSRIAFASTVHGYEGSGRGFTLRFRKQLDDHAPGWRELKLSAPLRWPEGDPLEQLAFRALLLDAEAAPDALAATVTADGIAIEPVDRDLLAADERLLRELFGLLVLAHYRTRPFDLRHLLDGPNLQAWLARHQGHVVAVALVAAEGGLAPELAAAVSRGQRRVRGHLLAQSLAAHLGLSEAAVMRSMRVMRIAVHPACQQRGIGAELLAAIAGHAREHGTDLLGSSFGGTAELLSFWRRAGYAPVRVGVTREASSGEHAVMVLKPLTERGEHVYRRAREHLRDNLPWQLAEPLTDLEPELADALLSSLEAQVALSEVDLEQLRLFAHGGRSYEDTLGALWKLALGTLTGAANARLAVEHRELLIVKLLQRRDWTQTAQAFGFTGRAQALAALRLAVGAALDASVQLSA